MFKFSLSYHEYRFCFTVACLVLCCRRPYLSGSFSKLVSMKHPTTHSFLIDLYTKRLITFYLLKNEISIAIMKIYCPIFF